MKDEIKIRSLLAAGMLGGIIVMAVFFLAPIVAGWDIATVMAAITIAVTLCNGVIPAYITYRVAGKEAFCMQTDVSVNVLDDGMVIISAWVENIGYKRFDTKITNLYIDKGKADDPTKDVFYKFPQLLKHKEQGGRYDCILAERCADEIMSYPSLCELGIDDKEIYEEFACSKIMSHLSHGSVDFILPGERFAEDIVIKLKSGVYRVTLVCVSGTKGCECSCSTKQFYVPEYNNRKLEEM